MKKEPNKPYHHGNLKHEFIERGLVHIDRYGVDNLSMRKLAEDIGVSSAAPYAHFKNKNAFLDSVRDYITDNLTDALKRTLDACTDQNKILIELGKCYILFFYENPLYYQFLFTTGKTDLSRNDAFQFFENVSFQVLSEKKKSGYSKNAIRNKTLAMWALVQGIVQIAMIDGILDKNTLDKEIEEIICSLEV